MTLRSHAKINLGLRILRKRTDGYHDLETIFHEIDLCDDIELLPSPHFACTTDHPHLAADESNLCLRAARLMQTAYAPGPAVELRLVKRIPIGAGLGGGSSNAAAVLRGLRAFWNVPATDDELESLAARLGSDAPFFIRGGTSEASGRGEVLTPIRLELPYWIVTATPDLHVSTPWAYQALHWTKNLAPVGLSRLWDRHDLAAALVNDFEPAVFEAYPSLGHLKQRMIDLGAAGASMSGSGSTVFGLFEQDAAARHALASLGHSAVVSITPPGWRRDRP